MKRNYQSCYMQKFIKVIYVTFFLLLIIFSCDDPSGGDNTAPLVSSITPVDDSDPVPVDENIIILFNESLDNGTFGTVTLAGTEYIDGNNCSILFTQTNTPDDTVIVNPDLDFDNQTNYAGILIMDFKDRAGNTMADYQDTEYDFTTIDAEAPEVISISTPLDNSTDVAVDTNIVIIFSESLDNLVPGSVSFGTPSMTLSDMNSTITFSETSAANDTVTINPDVDLDSETAYSNISIQGFEDETGNPMGVYTDTDYDFFTEDITPPGFLSISPADSATNVPVDSVMEIVFNESLDGVTPGTVSFANPVITFDDASNCEISFSTTTDANDTVIITPDAVLDTDTTYSQISITGFTDVSGNTMTTYNDTEYDFTTDDGSGPAVYVAGIIKRGGGYKGVLWEDSGGSVTEFPYTPLVANGLHKETGSLCHDGTDLYVISTLSISPPVTPPQYWLNANTTTYPLPYTDTYALCSDSWSDGGSVYISGRDEGVSDTVPVYWENTGGSFVKHELDISSETSGSATAINVTDGNIYIAGVTYDAIYNRNAAVWINSTHYVPLDASGRQTMADGIFFDGTDLYIGGSYNGEGFYYFACYWTDAEADGTDIVQTILDSTSPKGSCLTDITVDSSGVVYAVGSYTDNSDNVYYRYWVDNGSITTRSLTLPAGSTGAALSSIFILNDDIYISGEYTDSNGDDIACYWYDDGSTITCVPLTGNPYDGSMGRDIWVISN